ncbi:kinase-like domain-containing protein [Thelonectria olida]|uniref:non-specific serine/threonine protein kinase n=1 Tax=Thelonectria olida TaxID=1576542 RepID=A0A9P9AZS6_9HYPO|nr:kinase-like domain-containing protein [Thelonectria olida]
MLVRFLRDDPDVTTVEEGASSYVPGGFHPVYVGDVFKDRYKVLNKLGYGMYSTVWLVRDLKNTSSSRGPEHEFRALKILIADCYGWGDDDLYKTEVLDRLRRGDRTKLGYNYICHLLDDFVHRGPNGAHVCMVFELMGETLKAFGAWFNQGNLPEALVRRFTVQLLLALDFAHSLNIIHTDIKPDNIFLRFRDYSRIERYLQEVDTPMQDRDEAEYTIVPSQSLRKHYFSVVDGIDRVMEFDVALGDWGLACFEGKHRTQIIQSIPCRAPEVLLGERWDKSTDLWNLGCAVYEAWASESLFKGRVLPSTRYDLQQHLYEIVQLFGSFPYDLRCRADWNIVSEYFEPCGYVKDRPRRREGELAWRDTKFLPHVPDNDVRREFYEFLKALMPIDPLERTSAQHLMGHPWLESRSATAGE